MWRYQHIAELLGECYRKNRTNNIHTKCHQLESKLQHCLSLSLSRSLSLNYHVIKLKWMFNWNFSNFSLHFHIIYAAGRLLARLELFKLAFRISLKLRGEKRNFRLKSVHMTCDYTSNLNGSVMPINTTHSLAWIHLQINVCWIVKSYVWRTPATFAAKCDLFFFSISLLRFGMFVSVQITTQRITKSK